MRAQQVNVSFIAFQLKNEKRKTTLRKMLGRAEAKCEPRIANRLLFHDDSVRLILSLALIHVYALRRYSPALSLVLHVMIVARAVRRINKFSYSISLMMKNFSNSQATV